MEKNKQDLLQEQANKIDEVIKVLTELNIVGIEEPSEEVYTFRIRYQTGKTDLERSGLLRRLRAQQRG